MIRKPIKHKTSWTSSNGNKCQVRKAIKDHSCEECGFDIEKGDKYLEITYMGDDGMYHTIRICKQCYYKF